MFRCEVESAAGLNLFAFISGDAHLIIVYRDRIISLSAASLLTRVLNVQFFVDTAVFSTDRRVLAIARRSIGRILVVTLRTDSIQVCDEYFVPFNLGISALELDYYGHYFLVRCRQLLVFVCACPSASESSHIPAELTVQLPQNWPDDWPVRFISLPNGWFLAKGQVDVTNILSFAPYSNRQVITSNLPEDHNLSTEDVDWFPRDLSSSIGHLLLPNEEPSTSANNTIRLGENMSLLGNDLVWCGELLYLNAIYGGPTILDFAQHPMFLEASSATETPETDLPLSEDDYHETHSGSGEE